MKLEELLKLSVSNLFSYKVRSFLTMLGIIIGISSVVMMSSLGAGVKENITGDLNKLGVSNFEISIDTSPGQTYKSQDLLTQKDIKELKAKIATIEVTPDLMVTGAIDLLNEVSTQKITGEEEVFSHTDLYDFRANIEGAQKIFEYVLQGRVAF